LLRQLLGEGRELLPGSQARSWRKPLKFEEGPGFSSEDLRKSALPDTAPAAQQYQRRAIFSARGSQLFQLLFSPDEQRETPPMSIW
jgi:hypothetical protein